MYYIGLIKNSADNSANFLAHPVRTTSPECCSRLTNSVSAVYFQFTCLHVQQFCYEPHIENMRSLKKFIFLIKILRDTRFIQFASLQVHMKTSLRSEPMAMEMQQRQNHQKDEIIAPKKSN